MSQKRWMSMTAAGLLVLTACSGVGDQSDERTPAEVSASEVDAEVCSKIALRTDKLYERFDELVHGSDFDDAMARDLYMIGMERVTREMRRGSRVVDDADLKSILEGSADNDYSYEIYLREISADQMETLFGYMDQANSRCEAIGATSADADTSTYPMNEQTIPQPSQDESTPNE